VIRLVEPADRGPVVSAGIVVAALSILTITITTGWALKATVPMIALIVAAAVWYRQLLAWRTLLVLVLVVIMFIPMRRYELPASLPFKLEPYRVIVALVVLGWITSLLYDPKVRLRASGFEAPFLLYVFAALLSDVANPVRVKAEQTYVVKNLTFLLSFVLVFYLVVSVIRSLGHLELLLKTLVLCGAIVAVAAVIETRTYYNVFNHLQGIVPMIHLAEVPRAQDRGARLRAMASAEHPIALGAMLVLLIPLAIYLARKTRSRLYKVAAFLLAVGVMATVSRTGVLMLLVLGFYFVKLRPKETKRFWPLLLPGLLVVHVALPGTVGPLYHSFFPKGGLLAEQRASAGTRGSGRIADVGPSMGVFKQHPILGEGYGTRVTDFGKANAPILDDQWLGTLLETGIVGAGALLWLFCRVIRRLSRAAREDDSDIGWLYVGLAGAIAAFAFGMLTYDAFGFTQVTFLLFIAIAIASVLLQRHPPSASTANR
jgi:polysaccharide biosynthesis protein PslJ